MKKIALDLRGVSTKCKTGIEKYAYNLFREYLNFNQELYYIMGEVSEPIFNTERYINVDTPKSNIELSKKMLALKGYIAGIDLLHSPYYPVPERRTYKGIITIHDLAPLINKNWFISDNNFNFFNTEIRNSVKFVDRIIADSQATKNDIIDLFNVHEDKITVIYLGVDESYMDMMLYPKVNDKGTLEKYKVKRNYILSVCTIEPRKNIQRTLRAYEIFRERFKEKISLVLVGKLGWKYESLLQAIKESKFSDDIILTGYVADEDLPVLYKNSEVFIYPSLYEGFGLPVLEAMASGAPVITSNISSLPEVGGDSVMYCNPYDVESIAYVLEEVLTKPSLQSKLKEKGKARSKQFSWEKAAKQTRQIYLDCLK